MKKLDNILVTLKEYVKYYGHKCPASDQVQHSLNNILSEKDAIDQYDYNADVKHAMYEHLYYYAYSVLQGLRKARHLGLVLR